MVQPEISFELEKIQLCDRHNCKKVNTEQLSKTIDQLCEEIMEVGESSTIQALAGAVKELAIARAVLSKIEP